MTLLDIRRETGINNNCFNKYIETFDLFQSFNGHVLEAHPYRIQDYKEVEEHFKKMFVSNLENLIKYQTDYYANKSVKTVANRIDVDIDILLKYLNKNISRFLILNTAQPSKGGITQITRLDGSKRGVLDQKVEVNKETILNKISSFQIFKEMTYSKMNYQLERFEL